ncbi:MAG: hypothetical protein JST21_18760 [Bacteroidetes bacterium]|nr:hypothetical protein [Bacteroidota bacterium]
MAAKAQLVGPNSGGYLTTTDQGITLNDTWLARASLGTCWGGANDWWGLGFVGFNIAHYGSYATP